MYDEQLKDLRDKAEFLAAAEPLHIKNAFAETMTQAADAIEKLEHKVFILEGDREGLLAQIPRWIPVTERLPDSGVCVFVTDGLEVGEGWITEFINTKGHFLRWCAPTADIDIDRRPITHWMPLPEPPEEGDT